MDLSKQKNAYILPTAFLSFIANTFAVNTGTNIARATENQDWGY